MYYVYIIESVENKRYYIGQTNDLKERLVRRNNGRNLSTKAYMPWELKWWKEFETRGEAIKIEKKIKGIKKREGIKSLSQRICFGV